MYKTVRYILMHEKPSPCTGIFPHPELNDLTGITGKYVLKPDNAE